MGTITRNFANNLTTSGLLKPDAFNNDSFDNVTAVPSGSVETGDMQLISSATASSSASIEFSLGNYKEYQFYFDNLDADDGTYIQFQASTDSGSTYATTITSTAFSTQHNHADTFTSLAYASSFDQAQGTSFHYLTNTSGATSTPERTHSGYMKLFNPSSTTYVKHFISTISSAASDDYMMTLNLGGYFNTTSALTNFKFQATSGNINSGQILLFGIN
jgi:hypothetical protein